MVRVLLLLLPTLDYLWVSEESWTQSLFRTDAQIQQNFQICFDYFLLHVHPNRQYYSLYDSNWSQSLFYALLGMSYSSIIFIVNYISSWLSSSAHDFTSDLYSFLSNKTIIIWVQHRLKISTFIDKLCGPFIGYYYLDLFSFTNYEIFDYVSFVFCNYFLLNDLIFNVRVISTDC
jgi:hypothetical protein